MDESNQEGKLPESKGPEPTQGNSLKQIRTFQGDIADALTSQRESIYSIQQAEKQKTLTGNLAQSLEEEEHVAEKRKRVFLFLLGSVVLIGMAGFGGYYTYLEYRDRTAPPVVIAPVSRLVSAEHAVDLNITSLSREEIFAAVAREAQAGESGLLKHIVITSTTSVLFKKLESKAPGSLVRAFEPIFMLGSIGENRFLIFKLLSFENAFAGMLVWEKDMAADVGPLFSTSLLLKSIPPESVFKDTVFRNKDARVLSGTVEGEVVPVLLYSFFGDDTLIITENLETLQAIIDRLTREKLTR